jgi:CRISPR/Cas system-associated endoribonuclease Cas2
LIDYLKRLFRGQLEPEDVLKVKSNVGEDFKVFVESQVGKYLIVRANFERECVLSDIISADAEDWQKIVRLQERARLLGDFLTWIQQAIDEGEIANFQFKQLREESKGY